VWDHDQLAQTRATTTAATKIQAAAMSERSNCCNRDLAGGNDA